MDDPSSASSGIDALRDLERWLSGQAAHSAGISVVERESERRGREILRLALQAHIDARGDGDVGAAIVLAGEHGPLRLAHKRRHTRPLVTLFGEVRVTRVGYGAPGCEAIHPLDAQLMLPGRLWSYECQRRLLRAVVCGPFDEAIALVAEITGTTVPKRSAEQLVQEAAVDFETFYAARAAQAIAPADGEILVAAIDCKGIPMVKPGGAERIVRRGKGEKANKKKMATVAAVHSQPPSLRTPREVIDSLFGTQEPAERPKRPRPSHKRVWASLTASKDAFIADVKAEITRRDPNHERTWVIVTDGERALQRRVIKSFENVTLVSTSCTCSRSSGRSRTCCTQKAAPRPKRSSKHAPNGSSAAWPARSSKGSGRPRPSAGSPARKPRRSATSATTSIATASGCATTNTCATAGRSRPAPSRAPARTLSATGSNAQGCGGPPKPPKRSSSSEQRTSPETSTTTGSTTSNKTSNGYTARTPGKSS